MSLSVEVAGLELHGFHGALPEEKERGQRFVFDVRLVTGDEAARSDALEDAVDYREVVAIVREVSDGRSFDLLEGLAWSVAEALMERLPLIGVEVRVRKPDVRLGVPVEHAAVTVALGLDG